MGNPGGHRARHRWTFSSPTTENPLVPPRSLIPTSIRRASLRGAGLLLLVSSVGLTSGCERIKAALKDEAGAEQGDPVWQGDSTMLASNPSLLFRVMDHPKGQAVVPIATIGTQGFRRLSMGSRGWRALDLNYLQTGKDLDALRDGRVAGTVRMTRGMWNAGDPLDSLPGCPRPVPAGLAEVPPGVRLAVAGPRPKLNPVTPLSDGEVQAAIATIPTLIAPSSGISTSMIARYQREIHVMNTGISPRPSILVSYNDPEQVSDTLNPMTQRPRQFIVILDKGVYGYRPSYTYTTLGNGLAPPRLTFLDYLDVDSDGKAEVLFGTLLNKQYETTVALRYENDAWREVMRELVRCQIAIGRR